MLKFKPIIDEFKDVFLDGNEIDPACGGSNNAGKGRGRGSTRGGNS